MLKVFVKKSVELSDGRSMLLKDLIKDYERLLSEEALKKAPAPELKVGKWFRIDRNVIDKNKCEIYRKCIKEGTAGKDLWERFKRSNKIANSNPSQYPRVIEVYVFIHAWYYLTEKEMRDMCERVGDGMCDEVICDFELQMRICNGESVTDLLKKADKLPYMRIIELRNGGTGYFGGSSNDGMCPPVSLSMHDYHPYCRHIYDTPYAFRKL